MKQKTSLVPVFLIFLPGSVLAGQLDANQLSVWWGLPFAGILLSIVVLPQMVPAFWHGHFGKVTLAWAAAFLIPFATVFGPTPALGHVLHAFLVEYVPSFILLLIALYAVACGIYVRGNLHGSPELNVAMLAIGAA